jgi:transcription termination factor Rho
MEKYIHLAQVEQLIDEMIEEVEEEKKWYSNKDLTGVYVHNKLNIRIETLQELKSRLSPKN